jgi:hypothetical protein
VLATYSSGFVRTDQLTCALFFSFIMDIIQAMYINKKRMFLKETLIYYISNVSPDYCVMLYAITAFARLDYCKLFRSFQT